MAHETAQDPYQIWQTQTAPGQAFVVCSMFTKNYQAKAEQLAASLRSFGVPHALFEVPTVHRSISSKGSDDLTYSKPRLIKAAAQRFQRPVLYIDADCEIRQRPDLIWSLQKANVDFAVYNWLADPMSDAWAPYEPRPELTSYGRPRYWRYAFNIDYLSATQLICSGAVQYWSHSAASMTLLDRWERELTTLARTPDDECLDYAFNRAVQDKINVRRSWLPKEYARYAFWIYTSPVINHPDLPTTYKNADHFEQLGAKRVDAAQMVDGQKARPFPRSCIIDAEDKQLMLSDTQGQLAPIAPLPLPLYL
jgi:hypothetical protein